MRLHRHLATLASLTTLGLMACGAPLTAEDEQAGSGRHPCLDNVRVTPDGLVASCDQGYRFNDLDLGISKHTVTISSARGCDDLTGTAEVGDAEITIRLNEETGEVTYESSAVGWVQLSPGFEEDTLWVRWWQPGQDSATSKQVGCAGLAQQIAVMMVDRNEPQTCTSGDPDGEITATFTCPDLDETLASSQVYRTMFTPEHVAEVGLGHILAGEMDMVAGAHGSGNRAMVGSLGLLFGSLFSFSFQQNNFDINSQIGLGYNSANYY